MPPLAEAQAQGQARLIGVSNFTDRLPRAEPARCSARTRSPPTRSRSTPTCRRRSSATMRGASGLTLTAYQPLAQGPRHRRPGAPRDRRAARRRRRAAVALAFLMAEGHAVIPASSSAANLAANLPRARCGSTPDEIDPHPRARPRRARHRPGEVAELGRLSSRARSPSGTSARPTAPSRCCTAFRSTSPTASSSCWSARRAAASRPCCACSRGSRTSPPARSPSTAGWSTPCRRRSATSPWCSRATRSIRT